MPYADDLRGFSEPQSAQGESGSYFPALAAISGRYQAPPPNAGIGAFMDDPFERAAYRRAGRQVGPPERGTDADIAQAAMVLAPAPLRAVMSAPKIATAGLAAYNFLSGTDSAGGAEDTQGVKALQEKLRDAGFYTGPDALIDGNFGPATKRAKAAFDKAEQSRTDQERADRQLQAQEGASAAAREAAQAQRAAAEAQAEETRRRAADDVTKAAQREKGNTRLTEMENDLPVARRAIRDYGTAAGVSAGIVGGSLARAGVAKVSNALSKGAADKAEKLFENTVSGNPNRVARVDEYWRRGGAGAGVPFTPTPGTAPGFAANPNAKPIEDLYQPSKIKNLLTDFGVAGGFGAESAASGYLGSQYREELAKASDAAQADPSEINIRRLQSAKDNVAAADALMNFGRAGAISYGGAAMKYQRQPSVPSGVSAEAERLKLEAILRRKTTAQPKSSEGSRSAPANPAATVGMPPAAAGPAAWKARQVQP